jgi:NAD(P)H-hydrate repair Nnr-like enzyme with NAD(P)H-hydrate dehydratase domain
MPAGVVVLVTGVGLDFTGEPNGEPLVTGVELAAGDGDGIAGLVRVLLALGVHAIEKATLAANIVDIISDLLIVFSPKS